MKKALLLTAMIFCLLAINAQAHEYVDTLRIGLKFGQTAAASVTLSAEGG